MYVLLLNSPAHAINVFRYGPEILDYKKTVSLLDKNFYERLFKNCFVCFTHTFSIFDESGRLCSKNDNRSQFSNTQARTRTVLQSFVLGLLSDNDNQHFSPMLVLRVFTMRVPRSFVLCLFVN